MNVLKESQSDNGTIWAKQANGAAIISSNSLSGEVFGKINGKKTFGSKVELLMWRSLK